MQSQRFTLAMIVLGLVACSDSSSNPDGGTPDLAVVDARNSDASVHLDQGPMTGDLCSDAPGRHDRSKDAPAPIPDGTYTPPFQPDDAVRAAVVMAACTGNSANEFIQGLYARPTGGVGTIFSCMAKITTGCDGLLACVGATAIAGTCSASDTKCSGNVAVTCFAPLADLTSKTDCQALFGTSCQMVTVGTTSSPICQGATCSGPAYPLKGCKGSSIYTCVNGVEALTDNCSLRQLPCRDGACTGTGEPCTGKSSVCEGDTLAGCLEGYRLRTYCPALGSGFTCVASSKSGATCRQAVECDPSALTGKETCEGNQIVLCNAGRVAKVDCTSLGFKSCAAGKCAP